MSDVVPSHPATLRAMNLQHDIRAIRREVQRIAQGDYWKVHVGPLEANHIMAQLDVLDDLVAIAITPSGE